MTTDATSPRIYVQVWICLETAELVLGIFAPARVFALNGSTYEYLGEL